MFHSFAVVVYIFVEQIDTQGIPRTESVAKFTAEDFSFSPSGFIKSFRHILKVGSDIFLIRFLLGASVILLRSNYSLYLEKKFDASAQMTGWLISYGAVVNTFGGFLAGNVAKYYNDSVKMSYHSSLLLVLTLFLMMLSPGIPSFLICVTLLSVSTSLIRVCVTDLSIQRAGRGETGALLGLGQSTMAFARVVGPLLSGLALEFATSGPNLISICLAASGSYLITDRLINVKGKEDKND